MTVIAAAALMVSGTAVAVGAAGESDTVQLCRTTKRIGSVPEGTVTWPTDGTCAAATEPFDVAAPSAATALGERLTVAEATLQEQSADLDALTAKVNSQAGALTALTTKVDGQGTDITHLHEYAGRAARELFLLDAAVRAAHPVEFKMEVTRDGRVATVTVTGSGLKPGYPVEWWDSGDGLRVPIGAVDKDGRFSATFDYDCILFPLYADTTSVMGEETQTSAASCP